MVVAAMLAGCLDSPPMSVSGGTGDDGGIDTGDIDAGSCNTILHNQFDNEDEWEPYEEPETSVDVASDQVRILVSPSECEAYADITSWTAAPIDRTELVASLAIAGTTTGGAGISWASELENDYFDLEVHAGIVEAIEKLAGIPGETVLCTECPPYNPIKHARMRLYARSGTVHYQVAAATGEWTDIATTPVRPGSYEVIAFGFAEVDQVADMTVSDLVWRECNN